MTKGLLSKLVKASQTITNIWPNQKVGTRQVYAFLSYTFCHTIIFQDFLPISKDNSLLHKILFQSYLFLSSANVLEQMLTSLLYALH